MTYLYLFSEGDTVHTSIFSGCTTPRSAFSSRTTQILPPSLIFWGAQDCIHEGEPLGLSPQGSCPWSPKRDTRGCHQLSHHQPRWDGCWSCLQLCHDHQECSKRQTKGAWWHTGYSRSEPPLLTGVGCTVPVATPKVSLLSVGCRSPLSGADGHTWPWSHTREAL